MAREVADDVLVPGEDRTERFAVVGIDAEVVLTALMRRRAPRLVMPEDEHRPRVFAREPSSHSSCSGVTWPRSVPGPHGVEHREGDAVELARRKDRVRSFG